MKYMDSSHKTTSFDSDVLAGHRLDGGVRLYGNSSAQQVGVEAVGDSTGISLTVAAKGTGGQVRVGSTRLGSTCGVVLGSTTVANSSAMTAMPVKGLFQSSVAFTQAAISSGQLAEITIASTSADIEPGDLVQYEILWAAVPGVLAGGYRTSTAAASRLTMVLGVPGSSATATLSGTIRITWLDLT